jgi:glycine cleavage system aminomethyltransferase T
VVSGASAATLAGDVPELNTVVVKLGQHEEGRAVTQIVEHSEVLLYTRIRKSPFFYASRRHGVQKYSFYNHMYHPRHYGDPVEEYWQLLNGVTLWDVGVERQVEITGPDAFTLANMLVPRDLNKCAVGQCKYVFITAPDGGIINDPILLRLAENHFWISVADSDVLLWAMGVAYNSGLDVTISEPDVGPVQIQGPKSKDVLVDLFGDSVLDVPYYYLRDYELQGMDVVVSRTGYTSELGFEIYVRDASRNGVNVWEIVLEAGKPHGLAVIGPCHIRRIEGGILAYGADMWLDTNPYEVEMGYEWMVDLDQEADFVGKKALRRIKKEGIERKLVGVEIGGKKLGSYIDGTMIDFFPVYANDDRIGNVTSACYSPRLEKNIGYAMVPIEFAEFGTEVTVETPEERTSAVVVRKPFIDPQKQIPKQDLAAADAKDD